MDHYLFVDRLKGLAMLLVVMGHLLLTSFGNAEDNPLFAICETTEMQLFSFLSGYVVTTMSLKKLIIKTPKLLLPMLLVGLFYSLYSGRPCSAFFYSPFKSGYWYFIFMFYCYVCLCIITTFSPKYKSNTINALQDIFWLISFYALFKVLRSLMHLTWDNDLFSLSLFTGFWPYFYSGILARKYNLVGVLVENNIIFSLALLFYFPFVYMYCTNGIIYMHLASLCAVIFLFYLFSKRERFSSAIERVLGRIGKSSMDVYLYHFFFLNTINLQIVGTWVNDTHNYFIESIVASSIAILIAILSIFIGNVIKKSNLLRCIIYGDFLCK